MSEEENNVALEGAAPVVEEQSGAEIQDAAEPSDQDINWKKARETLSEQSNELKALRAELASLKTQQGQSPKTEQIAKDLLDGRDDDDLLTVKDFRKSFSEKERVYQQQIAELQIRSQYPDFDEVVNKYGTTLSEIEKNAILNSNDPYAAAYTICKKAEKYEKAEQPQGRHSDAIKATKNLQKPGSASSVGGAAALSEASKYENMSDDDILALSYKISHGIK